MNEKVTKPFKNKNFFEALKNAINGLVFAFKTENNIKIDVVVAILVIIVAILLKISYIELAIIMLTIGFVITFELLNTVIENTADLITEEYNEKVKVIKDISAGAVLVSSIITTIIGCIIFIHRIIQII